MFISGQAGFAAMPKVEIVGAPKEVLLGPVPMTYTEAKRYFKKHLNILGFERNRHIRFDLQFDNRFEHYAYVAVKRKRPFLPHWDWLSFGMLSSVSYVTYVGVDGKEFKVLDDGVNKRRRVSKEIKSRFFKNRQLWAMQENRIQSSATGEKYIQRPGEVRLLFEHPEKCDIKRVSEYPGELLYFANCNKRVSGQTEWQLKHYNQKTGKFSRIGRVLADDRELITGAVKNRQGSSFAYLVTKIPNQPKSELIDYVVVVNGDESERYKNLKGLTHHPNLPLVTFRASKKGEAAYRVMLNDLQIGGYPPLADPLFLEDRNVVMYPIEREGNLYRVEVEYKLTK